MGVYVGRGTTVAAGSASKIESNTGIAACTLYAVLCISNRSIANNGVLRWGL
jgi:hypothetical protein